MQQNDELFQQEPPPELFQPEQVYPQTAPSCISETLVGSKDK